MNPHFDNLLPTLCKIVSRTQETGNSFSLKVIPEEAKSVSFSPGQFNMLYAFGIGEVPISMSGDFEIEEGFVHTIKVVGKVTEALSGLKAGEKIGIRGPFGNSWPIDKIQNKDLVILAGGIGLAPLRPLIYYALRHREEFGQIAILYGARDPSDLLFCPELKSWEKSLDGNVFVTVDFGDASWSGYVGVVPNLIHYIPFSLEKASALLCGPEIMLKFAVKDLLQKRVAADSIWMAMERNMKCAIGTCGRCQYVQHFVCKDGPVFSFDKVEPFFYKKEV